MINEILSSGLPDLFLIAGIPAISLAAAALTDLERKNALD